MKKPTTFLALTPSLRIRLAATIDALIAFMDEIDGDADFEDTRDPDIEDGGDTEPNGDEEDFSPITEDVAAINYHDPLAPLAARDALERLSQIQRRMRAL